MTEAMQTCEDSQEGNVSAKSHPIFGVKPQQWIDLVYEMVNVTTTYERVYTGRVYTVDPVSQSLVLVNMDGNKVASVEVVPGHAVKKVTTLDGSPMANDIKKSMDSFFKPETVESKTLEQIQQHKTDLHAWFVKNKIPVRMSDDDSETLNVADTLFIHPPYTVDSCQSSNTIMLDRVQDLIRRMPKD